jgi:hypothetical protein
MLVYHSTPAENARSILEDGFLEGEIVLLPNGEQRGKFVSDTTIPADRGTLSS